MFGFIFYLIIIWIVVYNVFYRKCPPNSAMVIYNRADKKVLPKVITEGGAFVNPINQDFRILSFKKTKISVIQKSLLVKSNARINIDITCEVAISKNKVLLQNAAERLLGLSLFDISKWAKEIITGQLKLVCAIYTKEEIIEGSKFINDLRRSLNTELNKIGMGIVNLYINSVTDSTGEIKPQKQPTKKEEKTVQMPVKQSFEQEFGEIAKKEQLKKDEEKREIDEVYSSLFTNDSFEEFKKETEQFSAPSLNPEIKEVIEKVVEKTEEKITEQKTEQIQTSSEPSAESSTEPTPSPSDDIFASVRHYFENKN